VQFFEGLPQNAFTVRVVAHHELQHAGQKIFGSAAGRCAAFSGPIPVFGQETTPAGPGSPAIEGHSALNRKRYFQAAFARVVNRLFSNGEFAFSV